MSKGTLGFDGHRWFHFEVEVEVTIRQKIRVEAHDDPAHVAEQARHRMWSAVHHHGVKKSDIVIGPFKKTP